MINLSDSSQHQLSKAIRVGIVGCGRVAVHHLRFLAGIPNVQVVGLADFNKEQARLLGESFGIQNVHGSLDDLLSTTDLDVLHILTPPQYHYDQAIAAIQRGINVFVEKPTALSTREVEDMYDQAAKNGVSVCPDFIQLFHPLAQRMISLVESGVLGRVVHCECNLSLDLNSQDVREAKGLHWSHQLPGGVLHNTISHPLYLVLYWTGAPNRVTVFSRSFGNLPQGLTDNLDVLLEGDSISANLTLTAATKPRSYHVRLSCEKGVVNVDFNALSLVIEAEQGLPASISRLLSSFDKARQLASGGVKLISGFVRKTVVPYQGLQTLLPKYYESIGAGSPVPVSRALTVAVSQTEEAIFAQAGKLHLDCHPRPSRQSGVKQQERILLTGASGHLGSELARQLVEAGYYIRAFVRPLSHTDRLEQLGIELVYGDIRDCDALASAMESMNIVVHAAAALKGSKSYVVDSILGGVENVAKATVGTKVRRVIYISSMAVYDYLSIRDGSVITEAGPLEDEPELRGVATLGKRLAEDVALAHLSDDNPSWTILRPSMFFGNGRNIASLLGVRIGNLIVHFGTRRKKMRLIHVRDVSSAIIKVIQTDSTQGKTYVLSHPDRITAGQFAQECVSRGKQSSAHVFFVPYVIGRIGFGMVGLVLRMKGKQAGMNRHRLAYAFRGVEVDSSSLMKDTGWRPSNSLLQQLKENVSTKSPST